MAFRDVCECEKWQLDTLTVASLKEWFKRYCNWCWGSGYGNCDNCDKYYKHLLYLKKMEEFKASKEGAE